MSVIFSHCVLVPLNNIHDGAIARVLSFGAASGVGSLGGTSAVMRGVDSQKSGEFGRCVCRENSPLNEFSRSVVGSGGVGGHHWSRQHVGHPSERAVRKSMFILVRPSPQQILAGNLREMSCRYH